MKPKLNYRLAFFLVMLLALAVRLGMWTARIDRPGAFDKDDTQSYLEPGLQLLKDGTFPSYSRTPTYPLFLAVTSRVVSTNLGKLALVQIAISLLTIGLVYRLCFQLFGFRIAILSILIMAFDVTSAIVANQIITETLFTFLLVGCLTFLHYLHRKNSSGWPGVIGFSFLGLGFSVLTLCRPIAVLLFVPLGVWLYMTLRKRSPNSIVLILCFTASSMLLPVSWIIRNHAQTGRYFLTTISTTNLYEYRSAWNISRTQKCTFTEARNALKAKALAEQEKSGLSEQELARWKHSESFKILFGDPLLTLHQAVDGLVKMYIGISNSSINNLSKAREKDHFETSDTLIARQLKGFTGEGTPLWLTAVKVWAALYLLLLYCGVAYACIRLFRNSLSTEQRAVLWLLLFVIAYFTFFSVGAEAGSRFRVPVAPLLSILGAFGWVTFLDRFWKRRHKLANNPSDESEQMQEKTAPNIAT